MLLAAESFDIVKKITDHTWPGCTFNIGGMKVVWMSNGIAAMILVAVVLLAVILPLARRYRDVPRGGRNVLEIIVIFVRDMIARPALHDNAYRFMPFLLTMFVFVLGMNLLGLLPLEAMTDVLADYVPPLAGKTVGGTPTGILAVCGGLAAVTLVMVLVLSLRTAAVHYHHKYHWPLVVTTIFSPVLWIVSLAPPISGVAGVVMKGPMILIELVGVFARCIALMIRLFANMVAGHTLLAVFMMLIAQAAVDYLKNNQPHVFFIAPISVLASVGIDLLELLVAGLQAYVFTFLTAIFLGLAMEEGHAAE